MASLCAPGLELKSGVYRNLDITHGYIYKLYAKLVYRQTRFFMNHELHAPSLFVFDSTLLLAL